MASTEHRVVLFVCTGNTCRSIMAEYLAKRRHPNSIRFESAGIRLVASETPQHAVETLRADFEIDASAHMPRDLEHIDLSSFDAIVTIDDPGSNRIYKELIQRGVPPEVLVRWKIADPFGDDPVAYDKCALALQKALRTLPVGVTST